MTNNEIITQARLDLLKEGKLKSTGRQFTAVIVKNGEKTEIVVDEPEEIHTFAAWKQLGFSVKKGETAVARFAIWKYATKKAEETEDEVGRMFMKMSCFFSASQVEKRAG